jgi:hypothetical protein
MFRKAIFGVGLTALASSTVLAQRGAEDEVIDTTPQACVIVRRIDNTVVVDDRTVLFYMRGGDIYENFLKRSCPGLGRAKSFSYGVPTGRLCSSDMITVFDPFSPQPGQTCGLGEFRPITEERAGFLEAGPEASVTQPEVKTIDLPVEDADAQDAGAKPEADGDAESRE